MSLTLEQSINRLLNNEESFNTFVHGSDVQSYLARTGESVPSLRKFMKDLTAQVIGIAEQPHDELLFADLFKLINDNIGDPNVNFSEIFTQASALPENS